MSDLTSEQIKDISRKLISEGFAAGKSEDDIKMEMFSNKIPFSKLNTLFRSIAIELNLIVDPKKVTEAVNKAVAETLWDSCETWDMVEANVDGIVNDVNEELGVADAASFTRVLTLVTQYCKGESIELPKRVKKAAATRSRGGKVATEFVALFEGGPEAVPSKEQFYNACRPHVKAHKNAVDYTTMFYNICVAVKLGISLKEAISKTKDLPMPADPDAVAEAPLVEGGEDMQDGVEETEEMM